MDKKEIPPDPGSGGDPEVARFVALAEDSADFRLVIKQNINFVERLNRSTLLTVLGKCNASTGRAKTKETACAALFAWAESTPRESVAPNVVSNHQPDGNNEGPSSTRTLTKGVPKKRPPENAPTGANRRPTQSSDSEGEQMCREGSIGEMMLGVVNVTDRVQSAISAAQGVIQSASEGICIEKSGALEVLERLKMAASEIRGLQAGLRASHQAWRILDLAEINGSIGDVSGEMGPNIGPIPLGSTYVQAVKKGLTRGRNSTATQAQAERPSFMVEREIARKKIAERREALRKDHLALRFRAVSAGGAVANHLIAASVARTSGRSEDQYRLLITDVRTDRFGTYYVQVNEKDFEDVRNKLKAKMSTDSTILLDGIGEFKMFDPSVSEVKGKEPVVVKGVDLPLTMDQIVTEIWLSNRHFWNLPESDSVNDHIVGGQRLRMRKRDSSGFSDGEYINSKSVKIWLSPELIRIIKEDGATLRIGYRYHTVAHFNRAEKTCFHCGQRGTHIAAACRNKPRCCRCGGNHPLMLCSEREGETTPKGNTTPRASSGMEEFAACMAPRKPRPSYMREPISFSEKGESPRRRSALRREDDDDDMDTGELSWEERADLITSSNSRGKAPGFKSRGPSKP